MGAVVVGGGGGVVAGAVVSGKGVTVAGAFVRGASVLEMLGSALNDADADGDGDAEPVAAPTLPRAKNTRKITTTVARLPATAARPRSTQRGPRRGGGMTFVVSAPMPP